MEEVLAQISGKDTKSRLQGVANVQEYLDTVSKLSRDDTGNLVDAIVPLFKDNNFKVCQGALQALTVVIHKSGEYFRPHVNGVLPALVERLGDGKQPVRDAARDLLLSIMEVTSAASVLERVSSAWAHKNWHVREEILRATASALQFYGFPTAALQKEIVKQVAKLLEDPNGSVRETAVVTLEEVYRQVGNELWHDLKRLSVKPVKLKELGIRLESVNVLPTEHRPATAPTAGSMPSQKSPPSNGSRNVEGRRPLSARSDHSSHSSSTGPTPRSTKGGAGARREGWGSMPVDDSSKALHPQVVHSERELSREMDELAAQLQPEVDWEKRIQAMQKFESMVYGGAGEYDSFLSLLRQLREPIITQLSDRRSAILKQACQLLVVLVEVLGHELEHLMEHFVPVLLKVVPISVHIMSESADHCLHSIVHLARFPRMARQVCEAATKERAAKVRSCCQEYIRRILIQWDDHDCERQLDLLGSAIVSGINDADQHARASARKNFKLYAARWHEHGYKILAKLDTSSQKGLQDTRFLPEDEELMAISPSHLGATSVPRRAGSVRALSRAASDSSLGPRTDSMAAEAYMQQSASLGAATGRREADSAHAGQAPRAKPPPRGPLRVEVSNPSGAPVPGPLSAPAAIADPSTTMPHGGPATREAPRRVPLRQVAGAQGTGESMPHAIQNNAANRAAAGNVTASAHSEHEPDAAGPARRATGGGERGYASMAGAKRAARVPTTSESSSDHSSAAMQDALHPAQDWTPDQPGPRGTGIHGGAARVAAPRDHSEHHAHPHHSGMSDASASRFQYQSAGPSLSQVNALLSALGAAGTAWLARVEHFGELAEIFRERGECEGGITPAMGEPGGVLEKTVRMCCKHMGDAHHKVREAVLDLVLVLVTVAAGPLEGCLEDLMPGLVKGTVDSRQQTSSLSSKALQLIMQAHPPEVLLSPLLKSLDDTRITRARVALLEYAFRALSDSDPLRRNPHPPLSNSLQLRQWVSKVSDLAHDKNPELKHMALLCLATLYEDTKVGPLAILNHLDTLPSREQIDLRKELSNQIPTFEGDYQNYTHYKRTGTLNSFTPLISQGIASGAARAGPDAMAGDEDAQFSRQASSLGANTSVPERSASREGHGGAVQPVDHPGRHDESGGVPHTYRIKAWEDPNLAAPTGTEFLEKQLALHRAETEADVDISVHVMNTLGRYHSCHIPDDRCEILSQIANLSTTHPDVWVSFSGQILMILLETLADEQNIKVQETALQALNTMLPVQIEVLNDFLHQILPRVLAVATSTPQDTDVSKDLRKGVRVDASKCLEDLCGRLDPLRIMHCCLPLLPSPGAQAEDIGINVLHDHIEIPLSNALKCVSKAADRLSTEDLMRLVPSIIPSLVAAFNSKHTEVRKATVFCIVALHTKLGEWLAPHLTPLSQCQLKLITIYIQRAEKEKASLQIAG